jgi:cullin 1
VWQDPAQYVEAILQVHRKFSDVVQRWLKNDGGFVTSLDKACREIINRNALCQRNTAKSSELLVRYCDGLLRKGNRNPEAQEIEELLKNVVRGRPHTRTHVRRERKRHADKHKQSRIRTYTCIDTYRPLAVVLSIRGAQMVVFKYVDDKDVFQKFYSKMLAKRLVNNMSALEDSEESMISKLKVGRHTCDGRGRGWPWPLT